MNRIHEQWKLVLKKSGQMVFLFVVILYLISCVQNDREYGPARQRLKIDFDWKFTKGDFPEAFRMNFNDRGWQQNDVPHDWSILDTFSNNNPTVHSGGFASGGIGWYRKHFTLDRSDQSSEVSVEFGSV